MKKLWAGFAVALLLSACGGRGFMGGNSASVEQRDLFEKQEAQRQAEAAQKEKEFQILKEQEELKKQLAAQQAQAQAQKDGTARGTGAGDQGGVAAGGVDQGEQPSVSPLPPTTLTEQALKESAAAMNDPSNPLSQRSVYFGYDSSGVDAEYQQVIEAHAKFLMEHPEVRMRVEGNTDIRGSREYNLALGQRRADSVKRAFTLLGVPTTQIESVSFGKEKPRSAGDTEEAHSENRRVDLVYTSGELAK